jgi:DNA-binding transcriptional LysR family regulator
MTGFDDLALLRAFVGIVESGSISAAARRLKLPQPTLSRHLRTLEDRCGASLLQRDTHQMSLTETGRRLLADARTLLELAENAEQRLRADQTSLSGHLRVFATDGVHRYATPDQLSTDEPAGHRGASIHEPPGALDPGRVRCGRGCRSANG